MQTILLFGAGKSATVLIHYLLQQAASQNWHVVVVDADLALVRSKINSSPYSTAVSFDIRDEEQRFTQIAQAHIVISLLPPALHILVAEACIVHKKNLLTASYVDEGLKSLQSKIEEAGLLFLCEMGLDPGIDHMSAKKMIDEIRSKGGSITSFISHCGGLIAPESDDNPWHYKISWNPKSIILAGKQGAVYRENNSEIWLIYKQLFAQKRFVPIPGFGILCWYPNRNSIPYSVLYGLEDCPTFIRTTLRHEDFIQGWKNIIDLGLTDETLLYDTSNKSAKTFFTEHLEDHKSGSAIGQKIRESKILSGKSPTSDADLNQLIYLGLTDERIRINNGNCTAADVLQLVLEQTLALQPHDKDMVVMMHEIKYTISEQAYKHTSTLVLKGTDSHHTAMAKTVGLPLGIAAKLVLNGMIKEKGLQIPLSKEIYDPVLYELTKNGIEFTEEIKEVM